MYPKNFRSLCLPIAAAMLLAAGATAHAQVNVRMTTAQGDCLARTDAGGLRLVQGSTDLEASGVQLSGTGCQPQGGGNSAFDATVTVPATATVPATFDVQWSASASATQCFYAGNSTTGWPVGTSACTGQACAGSHTRSVTLNTAGTYKFSMVCTNDSGVGSGTTAASGGGGGTPPSPDNFALTAPATGTVGVPFAVSWTVANATSCTGRADRDGSSATLPGWTDATSATSPRNATPATAGTYTLSMTCSNASGSVNSQQATVVVAPGDSGACPNSPLTRQIAGDIQYPPKVGSNQPFRRGADLTKWEEIWGHQTTTDTAVLWPGVTGSSPVVTNFGRNSYVAAKFHVGDVPVTLQGSHGNISYFGGLNVTVAISTRCGDFQPEQVGCRGRDAPPSDQGSVFWRMANPTNFYCQLQPNTDYYLNIKNTDPTQANSNCASGASTCRLHVNSYQSD